MKWVDRVVLFVLTPDVLLQTANTEALCFQNCYTQPYHRLRRVISASRFKITISVLENDNTSCTRVLLLYYNTTYSILPNKRHDNIFTGWQKDDRLQFPAVCFVALMWPM